MASVDDLIGDIESRTKDVFFNNFETVPLGVLAEIAQIIAPRFIDSFLMAAEEGIHCGETLISCNYREFMPVVLSHEQVKHKTQIYKNAVYCTGERGVNLKSIGNVVQAMNLFIKYLHDHGNPVFFAIYRIDDRLNGGSLDQEAVKKRIKKYWLSFFISKQACQN